MPRLSKIGAAALAAFGWSSGSAGVTASYLVVAGGGGGAGGYEGGPGGAGGFLTGTATLNPTLSYTITVGAGGAGTAGNSGVNGGGAAPSSGTNSVFNSITAIGGGRGGYYVGGGNSVAGASGGSGGAATRGQTGGSGTSGQGNAGGNGSGTASGGGGGAGGVGGNGSGGSGGNGGVGLSSSITGSSVFYAGGGGGVGDSAAGTGGNGGGGVGSSNAGDVPGNGTANTGGGAGGARTQVSGGSGGSGIVIISYAGAQQFGGGVVTSVGGNTIHTFTTSGTLSPITSLSASYLVVAGGGGGGLGYGGGGGAGGLLTGSGLTIDTNSIYAVTVGAGGAASASGNNSVFISNTAIGGGYGGGIGARSGAAGGSGGGGQGFDGVANGTGGAGTSGQGFAGGTGYTLATIAGGGGGSSAVGAPGTLACGNGGNGTANSITGSSVTYGGGGGGGTYTNQGTQSTGGAGGGGAGGTPSGGAGVAGTANLGGGGGGGSGSGASVGGAGGSGVVIISYPGSTAQMSGGTVTIVGGNVIHTFTSSGYLTPLTLLNRSLRFRSSASAYLNRTFGSGNRKTWTWSAWVKRGSLANRQGLFSAGLISGTYNYHVIHFDSSDKLNFVYYPDTTSTTLTTTQVFRDPAAWYHVVVVWDTTQSTAANRAKVYVNGVQVTAFDSATYSAQNTDGFINSTAYNSGIHNLGRFPTSDTAYFDGYLTEVNFIDGQALTPSSFGSFNAYGSWSPVRYGGSYGTNGFYLPFTNNASTTTLGYDFSPNGNNWTTNNISLTAGSTYDSMTDVPTLTSATAANYAVWNPLDTSSNGTLSRANLQSTSVGVISGKASIAVSSGKWYWEVTCTGGNFSGVGSHIGIDSVTSPCVSSAGTRLGNTTTSYSYNSWNGQKLNNSVSSAYGSTYTNGDVISIALDLDNGKIWWAKNGTFQASGNPAAGTNAAYSGIAAGLYTAAVGDDTGGGIVLDLNCGQQPFVYTPPSGFVALNTYNL